MKKTAITLSFALALGSGLAGNAFAAGHSASPMQCMANCNMEYNACLMAGVDTTMAMTPQEGMDKIQMNMMAGAECNDGVRACYSHCSG